MFKDIIKKNEKCVELNTNYILFTLYACQNYPITSYVTKKQCIPSVKNNFNQIYLIQRKYFYSRISQNMYSYLLYIKNKNKQW